ncbi:response regulator [Nocardioides sp. zg-579]|uniref:Circadian input-output histidine kinase CikA n=1 Tax=Nocardioides marmotae TaxID=2663857 RepID=A0A6I3JG91_9ACTN|nr:response regulator [Nocardioides marmotae]MCR6033519.1 response regulator [Gordonia jinghuaiqii]MTB97177.1 response regulator [Nocardioides marmotae]QKE02096.1 response regulator [Nocardioides marmotae]
MELDAMFRAVVETSPDGYCVFDLDGRIRYANPALARMVGVAPEAASDLTVFDTLDEVGRQQFAAHLEDLRAGRFNEREVEVRLQRTDGTSTWVLTRESPLHGPDGELLGVLHRMTEWSDRRRDIEELVESRSRLAEAHRIARLGSWSWDVVHDVVTGAPEIHELYGVPAGEWPATYAEFLDVVHEDDREVVARSVREALEIGGPFEWEGRVRGAHGWVWTRGRGVCHHDPDGRPVAMSGTHQDVTAAKEAELALVDQVNQNVLMQAVASAANEARSLHELLGQARDLVLLHDDWERGRGFMAREDGSGVEPYYVTEDDRRADAEDPERVARELALAERAFDEGRSVWDEDRLSIAFPVSYAGRVHAVVVITSAPPLTRHRMVQDMVEAVAVQMARVAEREQAERQLAAARDQAMEASRQKSEFLATMSHEIRTPLNGVIGLNDLLLRSALDADQLRLASGVQVASRALLGVINDILDFSKIEAGRLELEEVDFEVRPVFDQVAAVMAESARAKGLELIVSCHPDVPEVLAGDPTRLAQVLTNLVSNAVKFTPRGEVFVRATCAPVDGGRTRLHVEVADTGVGVDPTKAPGLFEPFTQADASTTRVYGGTGLGLAISKEIVEALGGRIGFAANPGGGSVFSFSAVFDQPTGTAPDAGDAHARTWLADRRVLVVDDNTHNRLILEEQLRWWQVRAVSVGSATEAEAVLARARDEGDPFDAALLDMAMPDRDGLDLARALRRDAAYDDLSLVMLTSFTSVDPDEVAAAGIASCLTKPVLAPVLRGVLLRVLAGVEASPVAREPEPRAGAEQQVLVVEDNPVNQMVASGLLESMGYRVLTAEDGVEALEVLAERSVDAVLMDVQMPRLDGYAATRELRRREPDGCRVPVIAMTAAAVEGERERCLDAGMDDFLTKPVDPAALGAVLSQWIGAAGPAPSIEEEPVEPSPSNPVDGLDVERLDMLRDLDPGNTAYLDRAIGNFLANTGPAVDRLRELVAGDDVDGMRQAAHKLAGSALNLGVTDVGLTARELELLGDAGTTEGALPVLAALEAAVERGQRLLEGYRAGYSASS